MMKVIKIIIALLAIVLSVDVFGQLPKPIEQMTKEDVMGLTYDELLELPFEDVLKLADIVGVSLDELYELLLNKDVVSASKKVESSFEAPLSTSVISYDEIKETGARSVEEALRLIPGLIVREKTNGIFDVHIRGNDNLPPNHMLVYSENSMSLVMIDGRPVYNYAHGGTFWETLPVGLEDVERIEVVRGPSSALYGPNAVSGVVNIITKKPVSQKLEVDADVSMGTQIPVLLNLGLGKQFNNKLSFRITANAEMMRRNTEKLFVYRAEGGKGGWATTEELESLPDLVSGPIDTSGGVPSWAIPYNGQYYYAVYDPDDESDKMFPDPRLSRNRNSVNGYLFYDLSEDVNFGLKGGIQYSDVISTSMGDNPMSHVGRDSRTSYIDFNAKIKGLRIQTNYLFGWQDIIKQDTGFKVDIGLINANMEYDFNFGGFNLRPGIAFQQAEYDDTPYISTTARGFLNNKRDFESTAFSLRGDYTIADRVRLIAAGRVEKYSTNDKMYYSYQFIASYNLNDKHHFRVLHSRANRGPFLVDTYADYYWERDGRPTPGYIYFQGQKNMDLLTMTMNEFGYRIKPLKNIQADLEVFHTKTINYGALYPDSVQYDYALGRHWVRMSFDNIDMESEQIGVSANVSWVAKENLIVKLYGTWQQTKLTDYVPIGQDGTINAMLQVAAVTGGSNTNFPQQREDGDHKATPAFYGGFIVNYSPIEKLTFNLNSYFYSKQEFYTKYNPMERTDEMVTIDSKIIANVKVNYQLINTLDLFINARNIIGEKQEFGYMDDIGTLFLIGLNYNLN